MKRACYYNGVAVIVCVFLTIVGCSHLWFRTAITPSFLEIEGMHRLPLTTGIYFPEQFKDKFEAQYYQDEEGNLESLKEIVQKSFSHLFKDVIFIDSLNEVEESDVDVATIISGSLHLDIATLGITTKLKCTIVDLGGAVLYDGEGTGYYYTFPMFIHHSHLENSMVRAIIPVAREVLLSPLLREYAATEERPPVADRFKQR